MKERDSNIELLRIISTLFILIVHCNGWFLREWGGITTWSAGEGMLVGLTRSIIQSITCIGVDVFILISGFYSIKPKLKSVVNLFTILAFFYIGTYLLDVVVSDVTFTWRTLIVNLCAFSRENWFIQCYLFLILLSPILNAFVENYSQKPLLIYILIFLACAFYFGNIHDSTYFYFNGGYSITTFILIYLVGRYLRLYGMNNFNTLSKYKAFVLYILSVAAIVFVRFISKNEAQWLNYNSPLIILSALLFFVLFTKISFKSKFVNMLGASCLSVYILHTCSPIINWFAEYDVYIFTQFPFPLYLLMMLGGCIVIFILAIVLDKIRYLIVSPILRVIDKLKLMSYE